MFKVRPFENRTLSWWYRERDNLDMTPVYQRRSRLWSQEDKAYLIDSILNDFDIPKIYIADFTYANTPLNKNNKQYAIIDGKQRYEAIFDFFDDKLVLDYNFRYSENPELRLAGLGLKDLRANHPRVASKFENFNLSVVSVITDEEGKINELFVRLNRSKPLTGAEVRNAMLGKVPELARTIADHPFFHECIRFQTKRGQDLNAAAKLLITEFRGKFVETKRVHLDRFVQEGLQSETHDVERAADRVMRVLGRMRHIFVERDPLLSSQGPVTVFYWLVRTFADRHGGQIRDFLVQFETARKANRQLAKERADRADPQLSFYDALSRSTNDQSSLEGRFRILSDRLQNYLEYGSAA